MLRESLKKLKVSELKIEIRKVLANFKGFSKMKKSELIDVMIENESLFKHLDKPIDISKPTKTVVKKKAEETKKLKKEPTKYLSFVKEYRMDNNLSLKEAMKEIKDKGLYTAKSPAKPKLTEEQNQLRLDKRKVNKRVRPMLEEYQASINDGKQDKTLFVKLKKLIGMKKNKTQIKLRKVIKDRNMKLYNLLKELDIFENVDLEKEEATPVEKQVQKPVEKKEPEPTKPVEPIEPVEEEDPEKSLLEFRIIVEKFIKTPTEELNNKILDKLDLVDELDKNDEIRLNKALDRFEAGESAPKAPAPKAPAAKKTKKSPAKKAKSNLQKQKDKEEQDFKKDTPQFLKYKKNIEVFIKNRTDANYKKIDIDLGTEKTKSGRSWVTLYDRLGEKL